MRETQFESIVREVIRWRPWKPRSRAVPQGVRSSEEKLMRQTQFESVVREVIRWRPWKPDEPGYIDFVREDIDLLSVTIDWGDSSIEGSCLRSIAKVCAEYELDWKVELLDPLEESARKVKLGLDLCDDYAPTLWVTIEHRVKLN